jgi:hypothetical protein
MDFKFDFAYGDWLEMEGLVPYSEMVGIVGMFVGVTGSLWSRFRKWLGELDENCEIEC